MFLEMKWKLKSPFHMPSSQVRRVSKNCASVIFDSLRETLTDFHIFCQHYKETSRK